MRYIYNSFVLFYSKIFQTLKLNIFFVLSIFSICAYHFRIRKIGCSMTDIFNYKNTAEECDNLRTSLIQSAVMNFHFISGFESF